MREFSPQELPTTYPEAAEPSGFSRLAGKILGRFIGNEHRPTASRRIKSRDVFEDSKYDDLGSDE